MNKFWDNFLYIFTNGRPGTNFSTVNREKMTSVLPLVILPHFFLMCLILVNHIDRKPNPREERNRIQNKPTNNTIHFQISFSFFYIKYTIILLLCQLFF